MSTNAPTATDFLREAFSLAKVTLPKVWPIFVVYTLLSLPPLFFYQPDAKITSPSVWGFMVANLALYVFLDYYLITKALQQYRPSFIYPVSFGGFCAWLLAIMKKYVVVILPVFLISLVSGFIISAFHEKDALKPLFIIIALAGIMWGLYAGVRLLLVSPMALMRNRPILKNSWGLTREHFWSIVGAGVLLWLVSLVFFLPLSAAQIGLTHAKAGMLSVPMIAVTLLQALAGIAVMLLGASLICAIYRLLAQRATDHAAPNPN